MAVGDFDGDGKPDLFVLSPTTDQVTVLKSTGLGTFTVVGPFPAGTDPEGIALGDFTGDTHLDVIVTNRSVDTFSILVNVGGHLARRPGSDLRAALPAAVAAGFFDAGRESRRRRRELDRGAGAQIFLGNGAGGFTPSITLASGERVERPRRHGRLGRLDPGSRLPDARRRRGGARYRRAGLHVPEPLRVVGGGPGRLVVADVAGSTAKDVDLVRARRRHDRRAVRRRRRRLHRPGVLAPGHRRPAARARRRRLRRRRRARTSRSRARTGTRSRCSRSRRRAPSGPRRTPT